MNFFFSFFPLFPEFFYPKEDIVAEISQQPQHQLSLQRAPTRLARSDFKLVRWNMLLLPN